ncbi:hypothetical protein M5K25_009910 [Dendrobium thyrsiflorum]|uniref:Uncharacterized protein n=1 Tax=Dendrobium thyrsiflorum TaxID=117978 RepID=A0ABD0V7L2_DENTH
MAEWFFGKMMDRIINTCFDYLQDLVGQTGMKEALERLQKLHPMIQSVIFACNQAQIIDQNPALNRWLWQLRDAIDEAEDVLDDFEYMKHEEQLTKSMEETEKRKASSSASFQVIHSARKILKVGEGALKIDPNLKRLNEVVQKLDKVSAEVSTFLHLLESTKQEQQVQQGEFYKARETGSLPTNDLIGRGKDKEFVMQWLRKPSNEHRGTDLYRNISLLSIVGHGGMGKTTLLQHVYENDEITEEFDLKMWVCVSNNFDVKKVIADMLEYILMQKPNLDSIGALQANLKRLVKNKKFLLVLDDIWDEEVESKWENVLAPLSCGSLGSKVLVTTRMDSAASIIAKVIKKKKETFRLKGLEEGECLQLLNSHAFADVENLADHRKLKLITEEIAKKLSGAPLAAKVLGGILNSNLDETHWRKVLDFDTGIIKLGQNDIMPILRLSYAYLPQPLQSCFTFCCIFSQDHEFDKDDLVRMWIALGFIQSSYNQGETMEDIGGRYFDTLVKKSFFDKYGNYYKMHDLLQEMAQSVSAHECFRIIGENELPSRIPKTIRHLFIKTNNLDVVRKLGKYENLHSLHLTYSTDNQDFVDVLTEIFETFRTIRLLCINHQHLKMIPEAIGYLRHLRYLKIARTSVAQLPRSLSNLYHLMFIIYDKGGLHIHNDFLPKDLNNLFNLRYLKLPWDVIPGMHGIGKLKSLQGLDGFYVKSEIGYKIGELEHMNDLRQLRIKLLENVKDAEEACSAKLYQKRNLMDLSLEWSHIHINDWPPPPPEMSLECSRIPQTSRNIFDPYLDEKVFDNLQPHNSLKQLRIYSFMGVRSAIWMNNINLISNLECIRLEECLEWQTLPPFGQLPFLKSLILHNMPKVKRLDNKFHGNGKGCLFPSLKVLKIEKLEILEDWFDAAAVAKGDCLFPCLTELYLRDCQNLQELPFLPPKLKKLEIDNIGWKAFNWLQCASNCCIQELTITRNDELVSFPIETEQWFLPLHKLYFQELKSLRSLPSLASLSSLKILHVGNAPQLQMLPNIPASLERLMLNNLKSLQCLPSSLSISSLVVLELNNIPLLESLPDLPPSLCSMNIYCANLHCLPSCLPCLPCLQKISISDAPHLQELPELPSSLRRLKFRNLESLQSLPSSLTSLSSLEILSIDNVTQLRLLPNFPACLERLSLRELKSLQCFPSSLSSISSLKYIYLEDIPLLKSLPDVPPSLCWLRLYNLENLDCLPSCLSSLSSLREISIDNVPQLQELPNLPSSLCQLAFTELKSLQLLPNIPASLEKLTLSDLEALQCLPSSLSTSSLKNLNLISIPLLKSLPDLPRGLKSLTVYNCHPELMKRYQSFHRL